MTRYYDERNKFNTKKDTPISVRDYTNADELKTYYCSYCQRNLVKLIDSSLQNISYYCQNCSISVNPEEIDVRSDSPLITSDGPIETPAVSYPPEPTLGKKKVEIKGGLAELQKRGIKITSYTEGKG